MTIPSDALALRFNRSETADCKEAREGMGS